LYVSKHVLHETNPCKISYLVGFSSVDMVGKPNTFQQAAVARLLGLFSTRKWTLSCISERLMLADVRPVELDNDDERGGVWHWDNEIDDVPLDAIKCTGSGLIVGTIMK
jgi:hypothetical protein